MAYEIKFRFDSTDYILEPGEEVRKEVVQAFAKQFGDEKNAKLAEDLVSGREKRFKSSYDSRGHYYTFKKKSNYRWVVME